MGTEPAYEPAFRRLPTAGLAAKASPLLTGGLYPTPPLPPTTISSAQEQATPQERLQADLALLAQPRHAQWDPLGLLAVRALLRERLGILGHLEEQPLQQGAKEGINLILRLPGRCPQLPPLLVGAHYDGPPQSPGADDNASGVAALLELARCAPRRPVWLVAFDQEEEGLLGSRALAQRLRADGQPLHLMVSLEMLAYTSAKQRYPHPAIGWLYGTRGDFIALVANTRAMPLLPGLARRLGRHVKTKVLPVPWRGRPLSHTSFLRNPPNHLPCNKISSLDLPFLVAVTTGIEAALRTC